MMFSPPPQAGDRPLTAVLQLMSHHLDALAGEVHQVEHAVGDGLGDMPQGSGTIKQLQSLDFLRQSLEDLALLTLCITRAGTFGALSDAQADRIAQKLKLAATRALMEATNATAEPAAVDRTSGDLDLF